MKRDSLTLILGLLGPLTAQAEVPSVVTDIPPVQSLTARVMGDLGTPTLLVEPGASAHGYTLRPSEARALQQADLVFWVGPELTPQLGDTLSSLSAEAHVTGLLDLPGTVTHQFREGPVFTAGEEGDHAHGHDEHDHEHETEGRDHAGHEEGAEDHEHATHEDAHEHEAHGHEEHEQEEAAHAENDQGHEHAHDHSGTDPHAWLDPGNAALWAETMADALAEADPEHAETYRANAEALRADLAELDEEISARLEAIPDGAFVTFHDAYQYFEDHFGVPAAGSISLSDASEPSPARISALRDRVTEAGVSCVFAEPQFNPGLVESVFGGGEIRTGVLDPLGTGMKPGADLYPALLRRLAEELAACAG